MTPGASGTEFPRMDMLEKDRSGSTADINSVQFRVCFTPTKLPRLLRCR